MLLDRADSLPETQLKKLYPPVTIQIDPGQLSTLHTEIDQLKAVIEKLSQKPEPPPAVPGTKK